MKISLDRPQSWHRFGPYLAIAFVALCSHGLLLINDGTYWDDWLLLNHITAPGGRPLLYDMTREMGLPLLGTFFATLGDLSIVTHHRVVAFIMITLSACLVYRIFVDTSWLSHGEALTVALISLTYPAYQTSVALSTLQYSFFYCTFLVGALSVVHMAGSADRARALALRLLALVAFYLGFTVNSLLVFYFPLLAALLWRMAKTESTDLLARARAITLSHADFLALPFVYWAVKKVFFPTYGEYENYNVLTLSPLLNLQKTIGNLSIVVVQQSVEAFRLFLGHPELVAITGVAMVAIAVRAHSNRSEQTADGASGSRLRQSFLLLLVGAALLLAGALPYAMVGLTPSVSGWNTRHALLAGLPIAIILVALTRPLVGNNFSSDVYSFGARAVGLVFLASAILAFTLSTQTYYIGWQARAIKDKALMADLADNPILKTYSTFWIDDRFPLGGERLYRFYEWSSMLKLVWGGESRIGLQIQGYPPSAATLIGLTPYYTRRNNLSEYNPAGCPIGLVISRGKLQYSDRELVFEYLVHKYRKAAKLREFLHGVTDAQVVVVSNDPKCSLEGHR